MEWIRENWVFILFLIFFVAMHFSGHGCMGGHGKHGKEHNEGHKEHAGGSPSGEDWKGGDGCYT